MKSITSTALFVTLTTYLSSTLAAPAPQFPSIPIQGLPTGNIVCATSKETTTWTPSILSASLQFPSTSAAQTTSTYYPWGVSSEPSGADTSGADTSGADSFTQTYPIGPNPNIPPQFPSVCNTDTVLYYVELLDSDTPSTHDVAVYTVGNGAIYFCGVLTDSDNQVANGFHQCNAA